MLQEIIEIVFSDAGIEFSLAFLAARHLFPAFAAACDASAWFLDSVVDLDDQPSSEKLWKLKIHLGVRNSSLNWVAGKRFHSLNTNNAQAVTNGICSFQTVQAQDNCLWRHKKFNPRYR